MLDLVYPAGRVIFSSPSQSPTLARLAPGGVSRLASISRTDAVLLDECAVDLALTGKSAFLTGYAVISRTIAARYCAAPWQLTLNATRSPARPRPRS